MLNSWTGLYGEARGVQSGSGLHIVMNESSPLVLNVQKSATSTFLDESRTVILPHPILVSMECQPGTANGSAEWQCGPRLDVQRGDRADKQGVPAPGVVSVPDALPDRARDAAALQVGQPPHVQPELDGDDPVKTIHTGNGTADQCLQACRRHRECMQWSFGSFDNANGVFE